MKQHPADEITIISFLADLNTQALKTRGRVLLCLGNHELINIIENRFVYVSEPTKKYFNDNIVIFNFLYMIFSIVIDSDYS